jgi:hypothetical protein
MSECALVEVKIRKRLAQSEMHSDLIVGIKRGARLRERLECQEPRVTCRGERFQAGEVEKNRGFSRRQGRGSPAPVRRGRDDVLVSHLEHDAGGSTARQCAIKAAEAR